VGVTVVLFLASFQAKNIFNLYDPYSKRNKYVKIPKC